ncbi:Transcriptional regulator, ArsR family [Olavius algarvensis Delta 1 endosymbiont]|nr:Transcriptional regulator, ArsR family [Olavius algarvensis Delta 1 endosymbiont]
MNMKDLTPIFAALADPTRRAILERLALGEASAGQLAEPFGISKPAISKHLKVLEKANLIVRKKDAQWHRFQLQSDSLKLASDWIARYRQFWEDQFDALAEYLNKTHKGDMQ